MLLMFSTLLTFHVETLMFVSFLSKLNILAIVVAFRVSSSSVLDTVLSAVRLLNAPDESSLAKIRP